MEESTIDMARSLLFPAMRTITMFLLIGLASVAPARLPDREAPRATDLLRARHLADQIEKRLELPRPKRGGWVPGGGGFGQGHGPGASEKDRGPSEIRINIQAPKPSTRSR